MRKVRDFLTSFTSSLNPQFICPQVVPLPNTRGQSVADPGFPVGEGEPISDKGGFLQKCVKELDPLAGGGTCRGHP